MSAEPEAQVTHANVPRVGDVVETIYGRQEVMDVLHLPNADPSVYFRPERGGREWSVAVSQLSRVLQPRSD